MAARFHAIVVTAFALASAAHAGVITVGPSGVFADIQPAIDAAQPGDVLLVEPGSYSPFVLSKALRIYAQPGAEISMHPGVQAQVTGIPAGAEAVVHGLKLGTCPDPECFSAAPGDCFSMSVRDNAGTVLIQAQESLGIKVLNSALVIVDESSLFGSKLGSCSSFATYGPGVAVQATGSELWVIGSTLDGGDMAGGDFDVAGPGLRALDSAVYVAESSLLGGDGHAVIGVCFGLTFIGKDGRPGIDALGGSLIKVASGPGHAIEGGDGGVASSSCDGLGAPGIRLAGVSEMVLVDSIPVAGGTDGSPGGATHPPVETLDAATWQTTSTRFPLLAGPPQASIGSAVNLIASGNPGATANLFLALGLGPKTLVPGVDGAAALDLSTLLFLGGATLDAAGFATFPLAVPLVPALIGFLGAFQAVEAGGPQLAFSNPTAVAVFP